MSQASNSHVVVVGGGIAGLTAAYELSRGPDGPKVTLVESGDRFGGKLVATELAGYTVDGGADAFLARVPHAIDLCRELDLEDELVAPAERSAFLYIDGELHRFPEGLVLGVPTDLDALAGTGIISPEGIARAAEDLEMPPDRTDGDESVGDLVRRRLGDEVFDKLVGLLLAGINAGDPDHLSLEAGAPQLAAAGRSGSLIRGAREQRARAGDPDAPVFYSLAGGTGRLADRLVEQLGEQNVTIVSNTSVTDLATADDGSYRVGLGGDAPTELRADAVVVACPSFVTAELLGTLAPAVAAELGALEYASVAVVNLSWPLAAVDHDLDGSGVLVAESDGLLLTACSWGSRKWPQWSDDSHVVFRASVGRNHDSRHGSLSDPELTDQVIAELQPILGLTGEPADSAVIRWNQALPQYRPGHLDRVDAWEQRLAEEAPGVYLAGASQRGLGIPACIDSARTAARRALLALENATP